MTLIPPRDAARAAWTALPEATRRDALHQASKGEAVSDPAVAAVIAGVLRDRPAPSWMRRTAWYLPLAATFGGAVALQYFGVLSSDKFMTAVGVTVLAFVGVVFLASSVGGLAARIRRRRHGPLEDLSTGAIASYAELANVRRVLETAPSRVAAPLTVRGLPRLRRGLLFLALCAFVSVGLIALLDRVQDRTGDIHRLLHIHFSLSFGGAVIAAWISWGRHLRYLPLRIDQTGLRFGFSRIIAWPDVLGVGLVGPTPAFADIKPALVWTLRGRPDVNIDLEAIQLPPEEVILAARAYKAGMLTAVR